MFDQETRAVVSVEDPALDRSAMDIARYAKTRDPSLIIETPPQKARRYVVRRLRRAEYDFVRGLHFAKQPAGFIQVGLVRIDEPDGTKTLPARQVPNLCGKAGTQLVWDEAPGAELDALYDRVNQSEFYEIAGVIETMSGMRAGEAYSSSDERFTLLPVSQDALARLARLHAERTRTTS